MTRTVRCPYCHVDVELDGHWRELPGGIWAKHDQDERGIAYCLARPHPPRQISTLEVFA